MPNKKKGKSKVFRFCLHYLISPIMYINSCSQSPDLSVTNSHGPVTVWSEGSPVSSIHGSIFRFLTPISPWGWCPPMGSCGSISTGCWRSSEYLFQKWHPPGTPKAHEWDVGKKSRVLQCFRDKEKVKPTPATKAVKDNKSTYQHTQWRIFPQEQTVCWDSPPPLGVSADRKTKAPHFICG